MRDTASGSPPISVWALVLGGVGFACGFFGPIALVPEANQGPLLGIFVTGPGGVVLGAIAGIVARISPLSAIQRWKALVATGGVFGFGILFFCLPGPELRARIVDLEIRGCASPAASIDAATREWEARIEQVTWSPPRSGWRQDVARMLRDDPGVVLDAYVVQSRDIHQNRKPWNRGALFAEAWKPRGDTQQYFARDASANCDAYRANPSKLYLPSSGATRAWPPDLLPNYLGLQVLGDVPERYRDFAVR